MAEHVFMRRIIPSWDGWRLLAQRWKEGILNQWDRDALSLAGLLYILGQVPFVILIDGIDATGGAESTLLLGARYAAAPMLLAFLTVV
jgi:hypothetical protein